MLILLVLLGFVSHTTAAIVHDPLREFLWDIRDDLLGVLFTDTFLEPDGELVGKDVAH
jgi:hypothetical protein